MSFETARVLTTDYFKDEWDQSWLPIVWENQQAPVRNAAWGRFAVMQGESNPMAIGGQGFTRGVGIAVLQIFVPENAGTKTFTQNADRFASIFDLLRLNDGTTYLHFDTAGVVDAGKIDGWLQRNVRVAFRRDTHA